jgi:hypothetical protein
MKMFVYSRRDDSRMQIDQGGRLRTCYSNRASVQRQLIGSTDLHRWRYSHCPLRT